MRRLQSKSTLRRLERTTNISETLSKRKMSEVKLDVLECPQERHHHHLFHPPWLGDLDRQILPPSPPQLQQNSVPEAAVLRAASTSSCHPHHPPTYHHHHSPRHRHLHHPHNSISSSFVPLFHHLLFFLLLLLLVQGKSCIPFFLSLFMSHCFLRAGESLQNFVVC